MEEVSDESFGSTLLTGVPRKTLENTMRTPPYTVSSSMKTDNLTALRPLSKKAAP